MRKVAHLLESPLEGYGGQNVLVKELAEGLSTFCENYVFCPKGGANQIPANDLTSSFSYLPWEEGLSDDEIFRYLSNVIDASEIDLLIFHGGDFSWGPGRGRLSLINRLSKSGVICLFVNHQSTPLFSSLPTLIRPNSSVSIRSFSRFALSWFLKVLQLNQTKREITVSKFEQSQAKKRYFFFRQRIVQIYHSRIPSSRRGARVTFSKTKMILNVGHFAFRKGQHILLKAFARIAARHPLWKLQLVGSSTKDEYWNFLFSLAEKNQIQSQIDLITETPHPDAYFETASIYVQPSLVEAYGLALQEAMTFGCACVGSDSGGIPESISDPNLLYPKGDDLALSAILDRIMSDDLLLKQYQESARDHAVRFNRNYDQMIVDYKRVIQKCLKEAI